MSAKLINTSAKLIIMLAKPLDTNANLNIKSASLIA
jgi:hypothetical protein